MEGSAIRDCTSRSISGPPRIELRSIRATKSLKAAVHVLVNVYLSRPHNLAYPARVLSSEGRFMKRSEAGQSESWPEGQPEGRCGAWECASQAPTREALGFRPARNWVCHCELAGRGQASGAKMPCSRTSTGSAKSPEERTRVLRRRGGTLRGVAVCLCFPSVRETCRGRYQGAPFGISVSPHLRGEIN
jgi:hypothetical protein